jgi:hypothetical protein
LPNAFPRTRRIAFLPKKQAKTRKYRNNQQKTCGNRAFVIDKPFEKPQGKRRWVLSDPHKH